MVRRAGPDQRVRLATRRAELGDRIAAIEELAAREPSLSHDARAAEFDAASVRTAAGGRGRLEETLVQLGAAQTAETEANAALPGLEAAAEAAAGEAEKQQRAIHEQEKAVAAVQAERRRLELERLRWSDRIADLNRQQKATRADLASIDAGRTTRRARLAEARAGATAAEDAVRGLDQAVDHARQQLAEAEGESPGGEAELAEVARRLVALEEARVDARLRSRTLEGNLELIAREVELLEARMEEIRERMPMGQAPEEVPGGKAREREMRQLERLLEEIGPTNPLAESEHSELAARFATLDEQLADIEAARLDLEQLVARLREEEDARYDAVFGAVAAGFRSTLASSRPGERPHSPTSPAMTGHGAASRSSSSRRARSSRTSRCSARGSAR